jgi:hypothetical protein
MGSFGRELDIAFSPTLTATTDLMFDERGKTSDGQRAAQTLLHSGALTDGQHRRIVAAMQSGSSRVPWLTGLLVRAASDAGRRDIGATMREVNSTLAQITSDVELGQFDSATSEMDYTSQGMCERIPPEERHNYPYCSEAGSELSREIMDLIRMLSSGQNKVSIDRALKKRGYSRYELKNAAAQFVQNVRRVFKTGNLFSNEATNNDTSLVHDAINEMMQNTDFVQHMMQLMAMHLPPDYQWRSDQVAHVCRWWIMHYISLVRPQLVHAVIDCPTNDATSCRLAGLGVNGGPAIAKWHGSSAVMLKQPHGAPTSYTDQLQRSGRYLQSYLRFQSHVNLFLSDSRTSVFAKLTPQQRSDVRKKITNMNRTWKQNVRDLKSSWYLVPGYVENAFQKSDWGTAGATFAAENSPSGQMEDHLKGLNSRIKKAYEKILKSSNRTEVKTKDTNLAMQQTTQPSFEQDIAKGPPDSVTWWFIKLNPVLLDNPRYMFEILDGVKYGGEKVIPKAALWGGDLFRYNADQDFREYYMNAQLSEIVDRFQSNARSIASSVPIVCTKAHRAIDDGKAARASSQSPHRTVAGLKQLLYLAYEFEKEGPVSAYSQEIANFYADMHEYGIPLEQMAIPSHTQTKAEYDSVYATTPEDDTSAPVSDTLSTEQWITKLENAFDTSV